MRIAVLSSAARGGAGIAAFRVYEAIRAEENYAIDFLDMSVLGRVSADISPDVSATNKEITNTHFSIDLATRSRAWLLDLLAGYDYLNIHWSSWLLSTSEILALAQSGKKILFTMHDFYYITGGCHYPAGCSGYTEDCLGCPQVDEQLYSLMDVYFAAKLKKKIFSHNNVHLSAPSRFIVDSAVKSGIIPEHRAHVLRNAYKPAELEFEPRTANMFSLLLIADSFLEVRKGIELTIKSIIEFCRLNESNEQNFELHVVGNCDQDIPALLADCRLSLVMHGHVKEHAKLVEIFQQCKFMLTCSYEDNWPNILVEAGAYGCIPIVGMGHGCEEFCKEFKTGFIASEYTALAFADCLAEARAIPDNELAELQKELLLQVRATHAYDKVSSQYIRVLFEIHDNAYTEQGDVEKIDKSSELASRFTVSENFLGIATRELLSHFKLADKPVNSMKLSIAKSPFTTKDQLKFKIFIVIFEDQSSLQYTIGTDRSVVIKTMNDNNVPASCIFTDNSRSFGLSQIQVQLGH